MLDIDHTAQEQPDVWPGLEATKKNFSNSTEHEISAAHKN